MFYILQEKCFFLLLAILLLICKTCFLYNMLIFFPPLSKSNQSAGAFWKSGTLWHYRTMASHWWTEKTNQSFTINGKYDVFMNLCFMNVLLIDVITVDVIILHYVLINTNVSS